MMTPSRTSTQPTEGFGVVLQRPRRARRSACAMKRWSSALKFTALRQCRGGAAREAEVVPIIMNLAIEGVIGQKRIFSISL